MTLTSAGYDATVGETVWGASTAQLLGNTHGVAGAGDWQATVTGSSISIAAGTAYGWGVADVAVWHTHLT